MSHTSPHAAEMQKCIQNCSECHRVCLETIAHCLQMGGKHAAPDHIVLMADCVQICRTSEDFMVRGSGRHRLTCGVCADVCQQCAEDCDRVGEGDAHMKRCAEVCRRCAESCQRMAAA